MPVKRNKGFPRTGDCFSSCPSVLVTSGVNLLQGMFQEALTGTSQISQASWYTCHFPFLEIVSLDSSVPFKKSHLFTLRLAFGKGTHLKGYVEGAASCAHFSKVASVFDSRINMPRCY